MVKYNYIIGIDPDCDKSGVACVSVQEKKLLSLDNFRFPSLLSYLEIFSKSNDCLVVVEAGWLNESNWHLNSRDSKSVAAAKGNSVGRNHETGRKIVEMCKHYGIAVSEVRPLKKCWSGTNGKITHREIEQFITGFPNQSNQETRDAALLSWHFAGLPIKIRVGNKN
jgi:hypothetical protein